MKMVKKILVGSLLAVALLSFAGCKPEAEGTEGLIKVSGKKATVEYVNDSSALARAFKTLKTEHLDATCHISNKINKIDNPSDKLRTNGVMGFIFNLKKDDTTNEYSFTIAGVRYNQQNGKVEAYVETFTGVDGTKLEDELPDGKAASGYSYSGFGKEITGDFYNSTKDELNIWIDVVANDGETDGRKGGKGTYTVRFFDQDPERKNGVTKNTVAYKDGVNAKYTWTIEATDVSNKFADDKGLKSMKSDLGFYANVTAGQTLNGTWELKDVAMEAEETAE